MDMLIYAIYIVGFLVVFKLLIYGLLVKALLGIRLKKGDCHLHDISDIPLHLRNLFNVYADKLIGLGFIFSHCQLIDEYVVTAYSKKWNVVYFNSAEQCYANISISPLPDCNSPVKVEFVTFFADGSKLLTINGMIHDIIDTIPHTILIDPYAESLEIQFQTHVEQLSRLRPVKTLIEVDPDAYVADEKKTIDDYLNSLEAKGFVKKTLDSYYRLCLIPALRHGIKSLMGLKKLKSLQAKTRKLAQLQITTPAEVPVEVEVEAFSRMRDLQKSRNTGYIGKITVLLISLLLFMLAFGISFSMDIVFALVCIIFIHELGHYLAMRLFKYQDVQVLFIPFFGGATLGQARQATALQRVIVYLLGPAPGLIIGTICIWLYLIYNLELLRDFGSLMLILNYINLLPIVPLDGGRIFELILFSRYSFLKTVFLLLSMVILAVAGVSLHEPILLMIPFLLFISLRMQILQNRALTRLNKIIKADNLEINEADVAPVIFTLLRQKPFDKLAFAQKYQIAQHLLSNALKIQPTLGSTLLSLFMYVIVFLLPIFVTIGFTITFALAGSGSDYTQGVISFYPSPDAQKVLVTTMRGPFTPQSYVLDENGNLITKVGRSSGFLNPNLIWQPGRQYDCILYREEEHTFPHSELAVYNTPMILFDIKNNTKTIIKRPCPDIDDCHFIYRHWSDDGNFLYGTKSLKSGDMWRISSIFKQDIAAGSTSDLEIAPADSDKKISPLYFAHNKVILPDSMEENQTDKTFRIVDLDRLESKSIQLPSDIIRWHLTPDGKTLIALQKIINEKTVNHRLLSINLYTGTKKILLAGNILPQFSSDPNSLDNQSYVSIELSPLGQWLLCTAEKHDHKTIRWLISINEGTCHKLLDYDSNHTYAGIVFSQHETRLCAVYSSYLEGDDEIPDESNPGWIIVYDINNTEPKQINRIECRQHWYGFEFFGDDYLLCIESSPDSSWLKNKSELWKINVTTGSPQLFSPSTNQK